MLKYDKIRENNLRAKQTAEAKYFNVQPILRKELRERNLGDQKQTQASICFPIAIPKRLQGKHILPEFVSSVNR